VDSSRNL